MDEDKKETSAGTEAVSETKQITEDGSETVFPHRHQDPQELLDEQQNMLQSPSEELYDTRPQLRVYPNLEAAEAESQARVRSLLSPKEGDGCNQ